MGGPSKEYPISMKSGTAVAGALREAGYRVTELVVEHDVLEIPAHVEAAFVAFHGTFGEDGEAQKQLEAMGLPYTGSGPQASWTAFDKEASKACFTANGIAGAAYEIIGDASARTLEFPCVVKPLRQGSSIGVHIVRREEEWLAAFEEAVLHDGRVMVEAYIPGRELTVGIVGQQALPLVEIIAPEGNFDYRAKYTKGTTQYIVPAEVSDDLRRRCQRIALEAYAALGCCGMSRVDFRVPDDDHVYVLENNTIPGFTETSLLPKAARAAGIEFPQLCEMIMESASCGK